MASETITRNDLTAILSEVFRPIGNIRQVKTDVAVPAISGGGYTTVAVTAPSLDVGEVIIGNRLIETDAALQVTLRYSNGWWLNASNEYSGTASAHNVEVWWVILKNGAVTGVSDYIVEQGTSGIWTYRKWNSGIAECWGSSATLHPTFGSSYGNGYYAPAVADNNFPAGLFTAAPELILSPINADGVWLGVSALTSAGFTYYPYCVMSGAHYYRWDAYAVGTWK